MSGGTIDAEESIGVVKNGATAMVVTIEKQGHSSNVKSTQTVDKVEGNLTDVSLDSLDWPKASDPRRVILADCASSGSGHLTFKKTRFGFYIPRRKTCHS